MLRLHVVKAHSKHPPQTPQGNEQGRRELKPSEPPLKFIFYLNIYNIYKILTLKHIKAHTQNIQIHNIAPINYYFSTLIKCLL